MELKLYEIEKEYISLAQSIIDNDGVLDEEQEKALAINKEQLANKGQCYGYIIRQLKSEQDIIDIEIKRLEKLKSSRSKAVDRLKESISKAMELYEINKLETPTLTISFSKSEETVVDENIIDKKVWCDNKVVYTPNKTLIKQAIKNGDEVVGAYIKYKKNLQIK